MEGSVSVGGGDWEGKSKTAGWGGGRLTLTFEKGKEQSTCFTEICATEVTTTHVHRETSAGHAAISRALFIARENRFMMYKIFAALEGKGR